ncbi:unnamed protein product [Bursaphelenchus okinawaensis]|uniref:Uncharacterized protein n=1 Tax=Bursaphelenchus okinawaensis TaxID=465554 RepID=A0A811KZ03_9BILA|nr:unnamed protein product [Bursaphelenchus okinawaensis]CAG9114570.1 unnamed protein product [Bursaphelenchus okinawaensis]
MLRFFLTPALFFVATVSPTMIYIVVNAKHIERHLRFGYAVNMFNTICYIVTFTMLQPSFLLPSPFVLFRGSLQNRFSAVSLTIAWANLCSGIVATVLMRLLSNFKFSKLARIIIGTLPYAFLHLSAILPALMYVFMTTDRIENKLTPADLEMFREQQWLLHSGGLYYFPETEYTKIFWMLQTFSCVIVIFLFTILTIFEYCRRHKYSGFYILNVILFFISPWSVISCAMYFRLQSGMAMVQVAWMVTFLYPIMEAAAIAQLIRWRYATRHFMPKIDFSGRLGRWRVGEVDRPTSRDTV